MSTPLTGTLDGLLTFTERAKRLARELEQVDAGEPTTQLNTPTVHMIGTGRWHPGWQSKVDELDALLTEIATTEGSLAALFATLKATFHNVT